MKKLVSVSVSFAALVLLAVVSPTFRGGKPTASEPPVGERQESQDVVELAVEPSHQMAAQAKKRRSSDVWMEQKLRELFATIHDERKLSNGKDPESNRCEVDRIPERRMELYREIAKRPKTEEVGQ